MAVEFTKKIQLFLLLDRRSETQFRASSDIFVRSVVLLYSLLKMCSVH